MKNELSLMFLVQWVSLAKRHIEQFEGHYSSSVSWSQKAMCVVSYTTPTLTSFRVFRWNRSMPKTVRQPSGFPSSLKNVIHVFPIPSEMRISDPANPWIDGRKPDQSKANTRTSRVCSCDPYWVDLLLEKSVSFPRIISLSHSAWSSFLRRRWWLALGSWWRLPTWTWLWPFRKIHHI